MLPQETKGNAVATIERAGQPDQSTTPSSEHSPLLGHIPALDGLRALAVLGVMLYHSQLGIISGGFLGVDLFFVLSGFLITSLLLAEFQRQGSIDLIAFWGRRVRRLAPALIFMVIVTLSVAWLINNARGAANGRDAIASLLYVNNWNQTAVKTNYFDTFVGASPFLHTWSLGIEEQFYFVWPPLLVWFLASRGGRLSGLTSLVMAAAIASATLMSLRFDETNPTIAYVSTDTRLQTIAAGAAVAILMAGPQGHQIRTWLRAHSSVTRAATIVTFGLLLVAFVTVHDTSPWLFHGGFLLLAALCAALILLVVFAPSNAITRMLSLRPITAIGVVSYGLYLWHWPVFVLAGPNVLRLNGLPLTVVQWVLTALLALLSYVLIERPIRTRWVRDHWGLGVERMSLIIGITLALLLSIAVAANGKELPADGTEASSAGSGATSVYLYGDSVSYRLRHDFDPAAHPEFTILGTTELGCPPFPVTNMIAGQLDPPAEHCQQWYDTWTKDLPAKPADLSILPGSEWVLFDPVVDGKVLKFGSSEWAAYMSSVYDTYRIPLQAHSKRLVLMNQPCYRVFDDGVQTHPRIINDDARVKVYNQFVADYARSHNLAVIDTFNWLCGPGKDPEIIEGMKTRFDGLHYTYEGAQFVWSWLAPQLRELATTTS